MRKTIDIDEKLYDRIFAYAKLKGFKKVGYAVNLAIIEFLKKEAIQYSFHKSNKERSR